MEELFKRIKQRREELGMSMDTLAKKVGYTSRSTIARIEKGEIDIPQSKLIDIAQALRVTPAYLMGWEDEDGNDTYYYHLDVADYIQELHDRPELKVLFDASRNVSKEDIEQVATLLEKLKK